MNRTVLLLLAAMIGLFAYRSATTPSRGVAPSGLGSRAQVISTGEEVDLASHVQAKGYTIIEFMADW